MRPVPTVLGGSAIVFALSVVSVGAQRPRISPHETHSFTLDGSTITFDYGRPSKRGRQIWGGLVPWGRWWMPGADEATILTTQDPLAVGANLVIPPGQHTIYMLPAAETSKLIINNEVGQFHTRYDSRQDLGRVDLTMRKLSAVVEQLTFSVEARPQGGGDLKLWWDDREYSVGVVVRRP